MDNLQLRPGRPVANPGLAINNTVHGTGETVTNGTSHDAQPLDVAHQVRVQLEQLRRVCQAARRNKPRRARLARPEGGGCGVKSRDICPWLDERLREQFGTVKARLSVDVLCVLRQMRSHEWRGKALIDGDLLVLGDGRENRGGIPCCFSERSLSACFCISKPVGLSARKDPER